MPEIDTRPIVPILPEPYAERSSAPVACDGWPMDPAAAQARQAAAGSVVRTAVALDDNVAFEMALVPAGAFVMGNTSGESGGEFDEQPAARVEIERPFWMGVCEVTNAQFALFDPAHDSRVETKNAYQFGVHGYPMNRPEQPVVRVTWQKAMGYCRWLSDRTGRRFSLPTEAQWEYAARAGSATPLFFGDLDTDFSPFANMADAKMTEFASDPYTVDSPLVDPPKYDDWIPKDPRFNDGALLSTAPGSYRPNAWGLCDMHGNVSEWTRTTYAAYPYLADDGREDVGSSGRKVVRGGSWRDRPKRCTSSFRLSYQPYQRVYNVGFRIVCEEEETAPAVAAKTASR